jgi:hypothetical protein
LGNILKFGLGNNPIWEKHVEFAWETHGNPPRGWGNHQTRSWLGDPFDSPQSTLKNQVVSTFTYANFMGVV